MAAVCLLQFFFFVKTLNIVWERASADKCTLSTYSRPFLLTESYLLHNSSWLHTSHWLLLFVSKTSLPPVCITSPNNYCDILIITVTNSIISVIINNGQHQCFFAVFTTFQQLSRVWWGPKCSTGRRDELCSHGAEQVSNQEEIGELVVKDRGLR